VPGACSLGLVVPSVSLVWVNGVGRRLAANIDAGAMGGIYEFVKISSANLREKDDSLNTVYGGFLAGSILGLRRMRSVWT
jgi:hypothetical protein